MLSRSLSSRDCLYVRRQPIAKATAAGRRSNPSRQPADVSAAHARQFPARHYSTVDPVKDKFGEVLMF